MKNTLTMQDHNDIVVSLQYKILAEREKKLILAQENEDLRKQIRKNQELIRMNEEKIKRFRRNRKIR